MMPLTMADVGEPITIKRVGGKEETRKFLENLGFVRNHHPCFTSGRKCHCQCERFQSCHWKRYGHKNYDIAVAE